MNVKHALTREVMWQLMVLCSTGIARNGHLFHATVTFRASMIFGMRSTIFARLDRMRVMRLVTTVISGDAGGRAHHALWSHLISSIGVH